MRRVTVVDYGRGNLFSIARALDYLGVAHQVSETSSGVAAAECIILPGVGAFGDAMQGLRERDLIAPLVATARAGTPILGICQGMQVLVAQSEEFGLHGGLDLIPGTVKRLPEGGSDPDAIRIPNVGWRTLNGVRDDPVAGTPDEMYYFVHSFTPILTDRAHVVATVSVNGFEAAAIIRRDNIYGVQFHPEKSGPAGLALLHRFVSLAGEDLFAA